VYRGDGPVRWPDGRVGAALSSGRAVVGHIAAGSFPREMALLPDGTLLVTNYASGQVEAVDVASIPGG
jgi:hypothetical protein